VAYVCTDTGPQVEGQIAVGKHAEALAVKQGDVVRASIVTETNNNPDLFSASLSDLTQATSVRVAAANTPFDGESTFAVGTLDGTASQIPNFSSVRFTGVTWNASPFSNVPGLESLVLVDKHGRRLIRTGPVSSSGLSFVLQYLRSS
jgi:hypothetical protein